jgi:hypothetical protein
MQRIRWMQQSSIIEVIPQGLKPASLAVRSAEAKASAYLEAKVTVVGRFERLWRSLLLSQDDGNVAK